MGILWSSDCKSEISISERCMMKLIEERTPTERELYNSVPLEEDEWMRKIRCMDEIHSEVYGLNMESFLKLIEGIEKQLNLTEDCSADEVMKCLRKNPNCPIKCQGILDSFISCVDRKYVDRIHKTND